ncbi:Acetamidase/Formamidase [Thermothelomyces heterothallicus CBS 203.75]
MGNTGIRTFAKSISTNLLRNSLPFAGTIKDGETVKIESFDWTGGQIKIDDSADDVKNVDLTKVRYLSGPFEIEGSMPGDLLLVEIMDVQPFQDRPWGFTVIFDRHNAFAGLVHPGILGCAPSAKWNAREAALIAANRLDRDVAMPGARTIPGRPEHGGNCGIKNLSRGSKAYLPVHVPGAKFSVGDLHLSQGDGEISFCGAIEMAGIITMKCSVIKNGIPGPVEPQCAPVQYLYSEGFSITYATVAYWQTKLRCIEYLRRFGYSDYQIYHLLSCAPVQGHVAGIVDIHNACTTLGLPMDIFDFNISPSSTVGKLDMGPCAFESGRTEGLVRLEDAGTKSEIRFGDGLTYKQG